MKESMLRKLVFLLFLSTIICVLWAAGANSRKRVELEKSKELNQKLEKLTLANTVITNNLKSIQNKIADLQQKEYELKTNLIEEEKAKEELQSKLETTKQGQTQKIKTLEELKDTNTVLGEELIRLKEKELTLKQELEQLKQNKPKKKVNPEPKQKATNDDQQVNTQTNNFAW